MPESDLTLTNYPDRQAAAMSCLGRLIPNARNDGELCSAILANAGMARKVLVDEHTKLDQWLTEDLRQVEELLNEVGKLLPPGRSTALKPSCHGSSCGSRSGASLIWSLSAGSMTRRSF